jgi:hypothetical protein
MSATPFVAAVNKSHEAKFYMRIYEWFSWSAIFVEPQGPTVLARTATGLSSLMLSNWSLGVRFSE